MAKKEESEFLKKATALGLQQMLSNVEELLSIELTEAQRIATEEMKSQILNHLEEYKK